MHLTNYAVNKHNEKFVANGETAGEGGDASKCAARRCRPRPPRTPGPAFIPPAA